MMQKAWSSIEGVPYLFNATRQISRLHKTENQFWLKLSISGLWPKFGFIDGFEMMDKA